MNNFKRSHRSSKDTNRVSVDPSQNFKSSTSFPKQNTDLNQHKTLYYQLLITLTVFKGFLRQGCTINVNRQENFLNLRLVTKSVIRLGCRRNCYAVVAGRLGHIPGKCESPNHLDRLTCHFVASPAQKRDTIGNTSKK